MKSIQYNTQDVLDVFTSREEVVVAFMQVSLSRNGAWGMDTTYKTGFFSNPFMGAGHYRFVEF